jgi:hypothetical protein
MTRFLQRYPLSFIYHTPIADSTNGGVLQPRRDKKRVRFLTDLTVTAKGPQWKCVFKFMPSLKLVIVLLAPP